MSAENLPASGMVGAVEAAAGDLVADSATSANAATAHEDALLADEVRDLLRLARLKKPWWQDYSLMIAIFAFVLSLTTSIISALTSNRKDIHDQQAQLASIMQNLADLTLKQTELFTANQGKDYGNIAGIISLLTTQQFTLLHNANNIASRLGSNATTTELITIAQGLENAGNLTEANRLLNTAVSVATTPTEEALALRQLGTLEIRSAISSEMRAQGNSRFTQALQLERKYPDQAQFPQAEAYLKMFVEFDWAAALASVDCDDARRHFRDGQEYLRKIPPPSTAEVEKIRTLVNDDLQRGTINNQPGCAPAKPSG